MNLKDILVALKSLEWGELNEVRQEIDFLQNEQKEKAMKVAKYAKEIGMNITEELLLPSYSVPQDGRSAVKAKYMYVTSKGEEILWSGRGKKPKWAADMTEEELNKYKL